MFIIIARATAASAAAKTITKILKTCPSRLFKPENRLKAIKLMFAAFRTSSTPIKIATAFFLVIIAKIPREKSIEAIDR